MNRKLATALLGCKISNAEHAGGTLRVAVPTYGGPASPTFAWLLGGGGLGPGCIIHPKQLSIPISEIAQNKKN